MAGLEIADIGESDRAARICPARSTDKARAGSRHGRPGRSDSARHRRTIPPHHRGSASRAGPECQAQRANLSASSPGLAAEQPGEFASACAREVNREVAGTVEPRCTCGCVSSRPTEETRRPDAHLAGEPDDEAACRLVADAGGDHKHRIVEQGDQFVEGFCVIAPSLGLCGWPESMRPPTRKPARPT